ncbi:MAG: hypothetical protein NVS3B14_11680 [Ktedonobacteraceae bacterium]
MPLPEKRENMVRTRNILLTGCVLLLILSGCGASATKRQQAVSTPVESITPHTIPATTATQPALQLQHIFYIMMENHSASEIFGNTADAPYLNRLANSYGIATRSFGVTHPSLPNYLAAISGDFQGIFDDCTAGANVFCAPREFSSLLTGAEASRASNTAHLFSGQTLVDQLEAHHLTWKAYMQSMPSAGFTGGYAGLYGQKHDPFMYFANIRNNPARMQRIVPLTQLNADISSGALPNFVWISPDVCHDMHGASGSGLPGCATYDGAIALGDAFITTLVSQIMHSSAWNEGTAIVITWDEGASSDGCCKSPVGANGTLLGGGNVPLIVITSKGTGHIVLSNTAYNHYSLLGTIEQLWGLGCLANTCGMSQSDLLLPLFE